MEDSKHYSQFRWAVLGLISIVTICAAITMMSFAPLMGVIAKDLETNVGSATFGLMGLNMLAMAIGCAVSGYLLDRFGVFPVINCGMVLLIAGHALMPWLGHSYWPTVAIRVVEGIGAAPVFVAIGPAVARWFPPQEAGTAIGLQSVAITAGNLFGLIAAPRLALSRSWQNSMAWLSVGMAVALVIVIALSVMAEKRSPAEPVVASSTPTQAGVSKLVINRPFLVGLLGMCCGIWTMQAFMSLAPGYLAVAPPVGVGFGPMVAGKLMMAVLLSGMVASLVGGVLVDRVFGGKCWPVVLTGFAMIAVCVVLLVMPQIYHHQAALVLSLVLVGAGTPFINPVLMVFAAKIFPHSVVGRVVGSWMSIGLFSGAAGVMVASAALRSTGNYRLSMETISVVAVAGIVVALFLYRAESDPTSCSESKV
jgi:MFS family permease